MRTLISLKHAGDGHAIEGLAPNGTPLRFDGEDGMTGPTPMQHLLAAAGACALMDVAHILRKKRIPFTDLRVECVGERPDGGHPNPFLGIHLVFSASGEVPAKALEDAARLAMERYCNVAATLRAGIEPTFSAHVAPAPGALVAPQQRPPS